MHAFRGSIAWPSRSLSTLRRTSYLVSTQDSLPAGGRLRRAGLAPAGSLRKVSKNAYFIPFPLPQASPGATSAASACSAARQPHKQDLRASGPFVLGLEALVVLPLFRFDEPDVVALSPFWRVRRGRLYDLD